LANGEDARAMEAPIGTLYAGSSMLVTTLPPYWAEVENTDEGSVMSN